MTHPISLLNDLVTLLDEAETTAPNTNETHESIKNIAGQLLLSNEEDFLEIPKDALETFRKKIDERGAEISKGGGFKSLQAALKPKLSLTEKLLNKLKQELVYHKETVEIHSATPSTSKHDQQIILKIEEDTDYSYRLQRKAQAKHLKSEMIAFEETSLKKLKTLTPHSKLTIVAHGHAGKDIYSKVDSDIGYTPEDLANAIAKNAPQFIGKKEKQLEISLLVCEAALGGKEAFAARFAHSLKEKGIYANIYARDGIVELSMENDGASITRKTLVDGEHRKPGSKFHYFYAQEGSSPEKLMRTDVFAPKTSKIQK